MDGWDTTSTAMTFKKCFISNLPYLGCIMKLALALTCFCNPNAWLNMNESSLDRWKTCFHAEIEKKVNIVLELELELIQFVLCC